MSSTYSPILRTELIGAGDQAGTWGSTTNSNFQYIFEAAIAGYIAITVSPTSNNQVLTYVNGPSASAALDQSVYSILKLNAGTLGANFNIFAPPVSKQYVIWNNTSYTATFYNSTVIGNTTAAGSGAVIPAGAKVIIWSDGSSFYGNDTAIGNFNVAGSLTVTGTSTFTGIPTGPTAAIGTNTTQLATTAFVQTAIPAGTIAMWPTVTAPTGYLLCAGAAVSRTTYATLFAVIGTTFGSGDGSTTFNLPNYADKFPIGKGTTAPNINSTGGSNNAVVVSHNHGGTTSTIDINHTHNINFNTSTASSNHTHGPSSGSEFLNIGGGESLRGGTDLPFSRGATTAAAGADHVHAVSGDTGTMSANATHSHTISTDGVSGTNANLPPYLGINFIIKYA